MTVSELIDKLKLMPQDADVYCLYDLYADKDVDHVWLAKNGKVVLGRFQELVTESEDTPEGQPGDWTVP